MNIASSPNCVNMSNVIGNFVDGMVHPAMSTDESEAESVHHQLVERWFRDRFFIPRPYRSTSFCDSPEDKIHNDIIDDGSCDQSMALFADNLVTREIRSSIVAVSDDEGETCSLRPRCGAIPKNQGQASQEMQVKPPPGMVMVLDGSPFFPVDRACNSSNNFNESQRTEVTLDIDSDSDDESEDQDEANSMGFIRRTFSFDDQLPIIHRRGASLCNAIGLNTKPIDEEEDDEDSYIDEQLSFTIPVTTSSNTGNHRSKILFHVSIP